MRMNLVVPAFSLALLAITCSGIAAFRPGGLRTEYKTNPLGLDQRAPRFGWKLVSDDPQGRNVRQSAYQILVASSSEKLSADQGDLWNSGRIGTDATTQIAYAGKPLASGQQAFWKVRSWDGASQAMPW